MLLRWKPHQTRVASKFRSATCLCWCLNYRRYCLLCTEPALCCVPTLGFSSPSNEPMRAVLASFPISQMGTLRLKVSQLVTG